MSLLSCLLSIHIAGGTVALLSGPVPMLSHKGGWLHRRAGDVFAIAMLLAAVAGFMLALVKWNVLLMVIGVFTFFLVFCGLRAIRFLRQGRPMLLDDLVCITTMAFCTWLLWFGWVVHDAPALFFGSGGWVLSLRQLRLLHSAKTNWLIAHLIAMAGAYIATVSAFLVVNITFLPRSVVFIGPTILGTPLAVWAAIHYRRRDSRSVQAPIIRTSGVKPPARPQAMQLLPASDDAQR